MLFIHTGSMGNHSYNYIQYYLYRPWFMKYNTVIGLKENSPVGYLEVLVL